LPLKGPTIRTKTDSVTERVLAAKEASQGYSLLKEKFSPLQHGVARGVMPSTIEGLASLAEEKIMNARSRGEFTNLSGRGKPLQKDHLDNSPYVDRTGSSPCMGVMVEYFLNRILQRQGAAPPWVTAQMDLTSAFNTFRSSIRQDWLRHITRQITTSPGPVSSHISIARSYVQRELSSNYTSREYKVDWETREGKYHSLAVEELNSKTRGYNTIAPYVSRRGYTTLEKELVDCYRHVLPKIVSAVQENELRGHARSEEASVLPRGGMLGALTRGTRHIHVRREVEFSWMDLLRSLVKPRSRRY